MVVLGVIAMVAQQRVSLGPAVIAALGLVLLAGTLDGTTGDLLAPTVLAGVGVAVLVGSRTHHGTRTPIAMFGGNQHPAHLGRVDRVLRRQHAQQVLAVHDTEHRYTAAPAGDPSTPTTNGGSSSSLMHFSLARRALRSAARSQRPGDRRPSGGDP